MEVPAYCGYGVYGMIMACIMESIMRFRTLALRGDGPHGARYRERFS